MLIPRLVYICLWIYARAFDIALTQFQGGAPNPLSPPFTGVNPGFGTAPGQGNAGGVAFQRVPMNPVVGPGTGFGNTQNFGGNVGPGFGTQMTGLSNTQQGARTIPPGSGQEGPALGNTQQGAGTFFPGRQGQTPVLRNNQQRETNLRPGIGQQGIPFGNLQPLGGNSGLGIGQQGTGIGQPIQSQQFSSQQVTNPVPRERPLVQIVRSGQGVDNGQVRLIQDPRTGRVVRIPSSTNLPFNHQTGERLPISGRNVTNTPQFPSINSGPLAFQQQQQQQQFISGQFLTGATNPIPPDNRMAVPSSSTAGRSQRPALSGPVSSPHPPLFRICQRPRSVRCFPWPPDRNLREAYRCQGTCQGGRACAVPCQCSCVDSSALPRLIAMGRIRQPELRPNDVRLWQTEAEIARSRDQRRDFHVVPRPGGILEVRPNITSGVQPVLRNDSSALPFGIPDDILARLIAQPDLNNLIGPQGINDMLAGEPPILFPPGAGTHEPPLATTPQPPPRRQPMGGASGGIPVPLDLMNLQIDPSIPSLLAAAERLGIATSSTQMEGRLNFPSRSDFQVGSTVPGRERISASTSGGDSLADLRSILMQSGIPVDGGLRNASASMITLLQSEAGSQRDACVTQGRELWCEAAQGWGHTPGVRRWCLLNCRESTCDATRCACECVDDFVFRARYEQLGRSLGAVG